MKLNEEQKAKSTEAKKKTGRPAKAEKHGVEVAIEGDYVIVRIPRKELGKRLFSELFK